ncbi:MAG: DNA replication/repair protein RecF [Rhodospirillaceae bacterium]|nr:DNA replication/repair protein RecF [Rhodospirillaceae bacterium]
MAGSLAVRRLTLSDFRCYAALRLDLPEGPVVLAGPNGAGKTNILEALSFLIPGRGLRRARLSEAARRDPGEDPATPTRPWAVAATVAGPDGETDVGTGLGVSTGNDTEKRVVHVDGEPQRAQAALSEHVSLQWLTPQMDRLFLDGASARRRFLDRLVYGRDPAHAGRVGGYEQAMRERLRLLTARGAADDSWVSALEATMAERGVAIAAARLDMAGRLAGQLEAAGDGPFPAADLAVEGEVEAWLTAGSALDAEDRLKAALKAARGRDGDSGRTAHGPHRSDLHVAYKSRGRPAADCSTGEQKALLISLVLAQARLQAAEQGRAPILLLDEVAAHLDADRRAALFAEIETLGLQAWMTGTDLDLFGPLAGRAAFFHVAEAKVHRQDP